MLRYACKAHAGVVNLVTWTLERQEAVQFGAFRGWPSRVVPQVAQVAGVALMRDRPDATVSPLVRLVPNKRA